MRNRGVVIALLSACALLLIGWGVYLFVTLSDNTDTKDTKVPPGSVRIWCLTKEYDVREDGTEVLFFSGTYDRAGRCVSAEHYIVDDTDTMTETLKYEYEPENHYTIMTIRSDTLEMRECYDSTGQIKTLEYGYVNGFNVINCRLCVFDERGKIVSEIFYDDEGRKEGTRERSYDAYGYEVSCISRNFGSGEELVARRAEYDEQGRTVRIYDVDTETQREVLLRDIKYSNDGGRTEQRFGLYDEDKVPHVYIYNANGELVKEINYVAYEDGTLTVERTETEYENGLEVKQFLYVDDELRQVKETVRESEGRLRIETVTTRYTSGDGDDCEDIKITTLQLHGDSKPEDERYDSKEIRNISRLKDGTVYYDSSELYEFTYDENDNLTSYKKTRTTDGETRYCHGGRYVYEAKAVTMEQAQEKEEYHDCFYRQVMEEMIDKDNYGSLGW